MKEKKNTGKSRPTLLEMIVDSIPEGVLAVDCEGKAILWNRGVEEMTGTGRETMLGRGDYAYAVPFYGEPRPLLADILLGKNKKWEQEYWNIERKGEVLFGEGFAPRAYGGRGLHFWSIAAPIRDQAGNMLGAVQCIRDIGERKQMEDELRRLSIRDALTGLYNRNYFEEEMRRLEKSRDFPVSLILCDIDDLKKVNDSLGHLCGDELLCRAGKVIAGSIRGGDLLARVGGDEFTVVLAQTDREAAGEVMSRITKAVAEDNAAHPGFPLSISLGIATAEDANRPLIQVYKAADEAMYKSKQDYKTSLECGRGKAEETLFSLAFSRMAHETLDPEEVARRALKMVLGITGAAGGSVEILGEGSARETVATLPLGSEIRVFPDDEVIAAVWREKQAVQCDSLCRGATAGEIRPSLAVPISAGDAVTGVLILFRQREEGYFNEDKVAFLTTLGSLLGQALENARTHQQQESELSMLNKLAGLRQNLLEITTQNEALEKILVEVQNFFGMRRCVLRLLDEETGELLIAGSSGFSEELKKRAGRVRPEGSLLGEALQKKKTVAVDDINSAAPDLKMPYYAAEMRAIAVAPILAGGDALGTLKVYSPLPRRWSEDELGFLTTVAELLGLTLADLRLHDSLRQQSWKVVYALSAALESKDKYTRGHSLRVAMLAEKCARALDLNEKQRETVWLAAMAHDLGKIGLAENTFLKPGHLDQTEWEVIKRHPVVGANIIKEGELAEAVVAAVRHHHEDYGGGGYPDNLAGEEIPLPARIIRVADAYDAMTSDRPYRHRLPVAGATEELRRGARQQFDPHVVEAFLRIPGPEMENIDRHRNLGYHSYRDLVRFNGLPK